MSNIEQLTHLFEQVAQTRYRLPFHLASMVGWTSDEVRVISLVWGRNMLGEQKIHCHVIPLALDDISISPVPLVWLEELEEIV